MRQKRTASNFIAFNRYLQSNDDDFDTKSEDISPIRSLTHPPKTFHIPIYFQTPSFFILSFSS